MEFFDFFANHSKPMIGLDISSSAVKLIELSRSGDGYKVEAYRVLPLPPNTVIEKNIADIDALAEAIQTIVKRSGTKLKDTVVAVSDSSVITKEIELPAGLTDLQMEIQIEAEADQYIPYPMEEVAFDFDVIGPVENNPDLVRVLLAACRQENVEHRRQALEMAGLQPKVIDVEGFAIERAYKLLEGQSSGRSSGGDCRYRRHDVFIHGSGGRQNHLHPRTTVWRQATNGRNSATLRTLMGRSGRGQAKRRASGGL